MRTQEGEKMQAEELVWNSHLRPKATNNNLCPIHCLIVNMFIARQYNTLIKEKKENREKWKITVVCNLQDNMVI